MQQYTGVTRRHLSRINYTDSWGEAKVSTRALSFV